MKLISKLTVTIGLVLLLVMAPFTYLSIQSLKNLMLEQAVNSADYFGETIIRTTHNHMLENDRGKVYEAIREVGTQEGVDHIRMMNKDGTIIFSTDPSETGKLVDKKAAACNMCHASPHPLVSASSMSRSRQFRGPEGKRLLAITKPIYNEPSCSSAACHFHPAGQEILGVLDVTLSLEPMQAQLVSYGSKTVVATVSMLVLIGLILNLSLQRLVNRPVKLLLGLTKQVTRGDFDARVEPGSPDELGELTRAFNNMTQTLKTARAQLEDWGRNLETKVEQRAKEVKQMQTKLARSEKLASLGELVAGIAHELNNPLTGILVFASLLTRNSEVGESAKGDIDVIVRETQRCATIVKGLLEFSRESPPMKRLSSLNEIMEKTLSIIGHQSFFHDIRIEKNYNEGIPQVMVDPNQIEQVFINMLLNASQAMSGNGMLEIKTDVSEDGQWAVVEIGDTGCGIPEENLERIFDPFFTTKESKGTGLGLSVSYGIIQNHGGVVDVRSTVGVGTVFSVRLPMSVAEAAPQAA